MKEENIITDEDRNTDKIRIDKMLEVITGNEQKIRFLKMSMEIYQNSSNKLIAKKKADHYTETQKYCEQLLKQIR